MDHSLEEREGRQKWARDLLDIMIKIQICINGERCPLNIVKWKKYFKTSFQNMHDMASFRNVLCGCGWMYTHLEESIEDKHKYAHCRFSLGVGIPRDFYFLISFWIIFLIFTINMYHLYRKINKAISILKKIMPKNPNDNLARSSFASTLGWFLID